MPSRYRTGNNPFGGATIGSAKGISGASGLDSAKALDGATSRLTNEITQRTPKASMGTTVTHTPNGTIITPAPKVRRSSAVVFPWAVSLKKDNGTFKAIVTAGKLYSGLLDFTELTVEIEEDGDSVVAEDIVCIEYTYADDTLKVVVEPGEDFDPITRDGNDVVLTSLFPLAEIESVPESDNLKVKQIVKNDLTTTLICYDGKPVKYFLAI